jgi:tetratricopeptide (TPR) repeat protein
MRLLFVLFVLLGLGASLAPAQSSSAKGKITKGPPGYKKHIIHGFTLFINDEVYKNNDDPQWQRKPLEVLELELGTIVSKLPPKAVNVLRRLHVWIEWEDTSDPDLEQNVLAKYYGVYGDLVQWSLGRNKHPGKANNIEVINMKALTREHQPGVKLERCVLLHEMAHAVHHQLVGMNNPAVINAFRVAQQRGLYAEAKDVYGRTIRPTYAATNHREYFAELTCLYLDKLHYYPFDREEFKKYDPLGYKLMEQVYGSRKTIDAALRAKQEKEAAPRWSRAQTLYQVGKKQEAIDILEKLVEQYPDTKTAESARKLLPRWREESDK